MGSISQCDLKCHEEGDFLALVQTSFSGQRVHVCVGGGEMGGGVV